MMQIFGIAKIKQVCMLGMLSDQILHQFFIIGARKTVE